MCIVGGGRDGEGADRAGEGGSGDGKSGDGKSGGGGRSNAGLVGGERAGCCGQNGDMGGMRGGMYGMRPATMGQHSPGDESNMAKWHTPFCGQQNWSIVGQGSARSKHTDAPSTLLAVSPRPNRLKFWRRSERIARPHAMPQPLPVKDTPTMAERHDSAV